MLYFCVLHPVINIPHEHDHDVTMVRYKGYDIITCQLSRHFSYPVVHI